MRLAPPRPRRPIRNTLVTLCFLTLGVGCEQAQDNAAVDTVESAQSTAPSEQPSAPSEQPVAPSVQPPTAAEVAAANAQIDQEKERFLSRARAGASPEELGALRATISTLMTTGHRADAAAMPAAPAAAVAHRPVAALDQKAGPSRAALDAYLELAQKRDRFDHEAEIALHLAKNRMLGQ